MARVKGTGWVVRVQWLRYGWGIVLLTRWRLAPRRTSKRSQTKQPGASSSGTGSGFQGIVHIVCPQTVRKRMFSGSEWDCSPSTYRCCSKPLGVPPMLVQACFTRRLLREHEDWRALTSKDGVGNVTQGQGARDHAVFPTRGAACSNSTPQPGAKTFGGLEGGRFGTRSRYLIVCLWWRLLAFRHCSF